MEPSRSYPSHLETFARRSFNYLVNNYDERTRTPYFWTFLRARPPEFRHDAWDVGDGMGRRLDALVTCRIMTGDTAGTAREHEFREMLCACFKADGLLWRPEMPWCQSVAEMMDQASCIFGVVSDYLETGSAKAEGIIEGLARGLLKIAHRDGKGIFFPGSTYFPGGWTPRGSIAAGPHDHRQDETWLEGDPAYYGRLLIPLTRYAQASGSKAAMELCEGLAYNMVYQSGRFAADGGFSRADFGEQSVWTNGHFHSRYATAAGLVRFGRLVGRGEYIDFARRVFDWGLRYGTSFGWFPEFAGRRTAEEGCETCTITDAIDLATQFGQLGDADAWAMAERFAANQLVENQVWDVGFCAKAGDSPAVWDCPQSRVPGSSNNWGQSQTAGLSPTEMSSFDRVASRSIGGFAGWSAPNDLISGYDDPGWDKTGDRPDLRRTLMDCCGGYGNRGLYLAWHNIVTRDAAGDVAINMLLSRRTEDLTVESLLPAQDLVRITMHNERAVRIRVPSWASERISVATAEGRAIQTRREGAYLCLGASACDKLPAGTVVHIRFGASPRKEKVTVGEKGLTGLKDYEVMWLGDRVVGISPAGQFSPLYNHRAGAMKGPAGFLHCHLPKNEIDW